MSEPRKELTEYQKAASVARYVEVSEIMLTSMAASLVVPRRVALEAVGIGISFEKSTAFRFNEETRSLSVDVKFDCALKSASPVAAEEQNSKAIEEKQLVSLTCAFTVDYLFTATGGPPADERDSYFQAFANLNGMFNTWPYLRELVHSTVMRMGLPGIILPVYRVASQTPPKLATSPKQQLAAG